MATEEKRKPRVRTLTKTERLVGLLTEAIEILDEIEGEVWPVISSRVSACLTSVERYK